MFQETERMVAIVTELRKLGATVEEGRDYCVITPPPGGGASWPAGARHGLRGHWAARRREREG